MTSPADNARRDDEEQVIAHSDGLMPDAPEDPLDEARALAKVWQGLFGGGTEAPRVDQYYLLRELGAGAMGVVYSAFDPELQRHVALKLLHAHRGSPKESERMLREARALAKISHPNVVGVHAVGSGPRGAYIAMEYVEGQTLARWLRQPGKPRPWREVVAQFIAVGRGLAAAHDAGIVHRDFKPANVLVGNDGIARVADFGLAAESQQEPSDDCETTAKTSHGRGTITRLGTPAYMSPEQRDGAEPTPAADQYAFFVSLHEGLFGVRPDSPDAAQASSSGPPAVLRVLSRGLATDPRQRYPSMHAVVDALSSATGPGRWRRFVPWVIAAASVATTALVASNRDEAAEPCIGDADATASLRGAGPDEALSATLERYADAWTDARQEACLVHDRGEESDALFDARMECLTRHRRTAEALADVIRSGSVGLAHADRLVADLPAVEECRIPGSLLTGVLRPDTPDARAQGEQLLLTVREQFVRLEAGLGPNEGAVAEIRTGLAETEDRFARGQAQRFLSRLETENADRRRRLVAAVADAVVSHDPDLAVVARLELSHAQLIDGDTAASRETLAVAEAANERLAALDPAFEQTSAWYRGAIAAERSHHARLQGDGEGALAASRQSAVAWEHFVDTSPVWVAIAINNVGEGLRLVGRPTEAVAYYDRAEELARRRLDADHPKVIAIHSNRGAARIDSGDLTGGAEDLTRALELLDDDEAFTHALLRFNLAVVATMREQHDEARAHYRAAEANFGARKDPESQINAIMARVGIAANERDVSVAERELRAAFEALSTRVTAPDPRLAEILMEWARLDHRAGRDQAARTRAADALRMLEDAGVDAGVELARTLIVAAQMQADDRLDRAIEILEALGRNHHLLAEAWVTAAERRPDDARRGHWLDRAAQLADLYELGPQLRSRIDAARNEARDG